MFIVCYCNEMPEAGYLKRKEVILTPVQGQEVTSSNGLPAGNVTRQLVTTQQSGGAPLLSFLSLFL